MNMTVFGCSRFAVDDWSGDGFVGFVFRSSLLYLDLYSFLVNSWSGHFLFVVSVTCNINCSNSFSSLNNSFSGDWVSVHNFIRLINILDLDILFFSDRLNVCLGDVLVSRKSVVSGSRVILLLNRSVDSRKSSSNSLSRLYSDTLSDSINCWLDESSVID